jgi:tetratricopeptide (TPR) repeat protein
MCDAVWRALERRDVRAAFTQCRTLVAEFPQYAEGWRVASEVAEALGDAARALSAIERALDLQPARADWRVRKAVCLFAAGQSQSARQLAIMLAEEPPSDPAACDRLGYLLSRVDEHELSLRAYRRAVELEPHNAGTWYNLAVVQRFLGHLGDAEASLNRVISLAPGDAEACALRSSLRGQTADRNHIEKLESMLRGENIAASRMHLHYALAKEYEDIGDFARSFTHLQQGSGLRRKAMQYDAERDLRTFDDVIATFTARELERARSSCESEEPIFIIGLPRTGTSLVESILTEHPEVAGGGELGEFALQLTRQLEERAGGKLERTEMIRRSLSVDFDRLGEDYLASARPYGRAVRRFTDKLPFSYFHAGLIHLALPKARIVALERHPLDACFAIYKELFQEAYPFSYDLGELGQYYVRFHRLMNHWWEAMPGVIHTVRYEDLVTDAEGTVRALLAYCGLPWEEQCLQAVARWPIDRMPSAQWRRYEGSLEPLRKLFEAERVTI